MENWSKLNLPSMKPHPSKYIVWFQSTLNTKAMLWFGGFDLWITKLPVLPPQKKLTCPLKNGAWKTTCTFLFEMAPFWGHISFQWFSPTSHSSLHPTGDQPSHPWPRHRNLVRLGIPQSWSAVLRPKAPFRWVFSMHGRQDVVWHSGDI